MSHGLLQYMELAAGEPGQQSEKKKASINGMSCTSSFNYLSSVFVRDDKICPMSDKFLFSVNTAKGVINFLLFDPSWP